MQSVTKYPDLVISQCPTGCENCAEVYVNEDTGHRILCKCIKCNHGNLKNKIKEQREVDKEGQFPNQPLVESNTLLAPISPRTEDKN
jgi:hypothetical protein